MIEIHTLRGPEFHEVVIAVDTDVITDTFWTYLSSFWSDHKSRMHYGVKVKMLEMLAEQCFYVQFANDYNSYGVMKAFADKEGWCAMDGSMGILIVSVDVLEVDCTLLSTRTQTEMPKAPTGNW